MAADTVIVFGKYAGMKLGDVPKDYIEWMLNNQRQKTAEFEEELRRREAVETANADLTEQIAKAGYREMAKKLHPDTGGDAKQFAELKAAYEQLMMAVGEIKRAKQTVSTSE